MMLIKQIFLLCGVVVMWNVACASTQLVNELRDTLPGQAVLRRAMFDLDCKELTLTELKPLTTTRGSVEPAKGVYGASGCGRKASYDVQCELHQDDTSCDALMSSSVMQPESAHISVQN